jgi:hypothetical protein
MFLCVAKRLTEHSGIVTLDSISMHRAAARLGGLTTDELTDVSESGMRNSRPLSGLAPLLSYRISRENRKI